eukprot:CFRG5684T1
MDGNVDFTVARDIARKKRIALAKLKQRKYHAQLPQSQISTQLHHSRPVTKHVELSHRRQLTNSTISTTVYERVHGVNVVFADTSRINTTENANSKSETPSTLIQQQLNPLSASIPLLTPSTTVIRLKVQCELVCRDTVVFKPAVTVNNIFNHIMERVDGKYDSKKQYWKVPVGLYLETCRNLNETGKFNVQGLPKFLSNPKVIKQLSKPIDTSTISLTDSLLPPETLYQLLPFQKEGIQFAIRRRGRVLIADEMGLGKTVQAVCIACYYCTEWPALVIVPASLRHQWRDAFMKWCPNLDSNEINVIDSGKDSLGPAAVNIITYDLVTKYADELKRREYQVLILDECQKIKNHVAKRTKDILPLTKAAARVILLSGTPATSKPIELLTSIQAIYPNMFHSIREFGLRYCSAYESKFGWNYDGNSRLDELNTILKEFIMVRRYKSEVQEDLAKLSSLVKKTRHRVSLKISEEVQKRLQEGMRKDDTSNFLEFYHATAIAKIPAVCEFVRRVLNTGLKFVVFCHHSEMMDSIMRVLESKFVEYIRIDGSTNSKLRQTRANSFQDDPSCRVALLSLLAANAGLTLTAAATVIFAELSWNPGDLLQAEDRVHRISQVQDVNIQYLHAPNTMDDVMWTKLNSKLGVLGKAGLGNKSGTTSAASE